MAASKVDTDLCSRKHRSRKVDATTQRRLHFNSHFDRVHVKQIPKPWQMFTIRLQYKWLCARQDAAGKITGSQNLLPSTCQDIEQWHEQNSRLASLCLSPQKFLLCVAANEQLLGLTSRLQEVATHTDILVKQHKHILTESLETSWLKVGHCFPAGTHNTAACIWLDS